jgi:tetratricopeptide (TPR) repeat protein
VQAQNLIQARKWAEAQRRIDDFTEEGRQNDPRVAGMRQQIEQGRRADIVSLLGAIATALSARQWTQAWDSVNQFEQLAPDDPRLAKWRNQVQAGIASDRELDGLRASIRTAIGEKNWIKADIEIASLLANAPGDPHAGEWRRAVELGRDADQVSKSLNSQRQQQEETDLANAEKLRQQGAYPAAIKLFQQVLSQDPASARAQKGLKLATDAKATEDRVFGRGHQ